MSNSFKFNGSLTDKPKLCVVGVGGGGGNAVNDMITRGIKGSNSLRSIRMHRRSERILRR